MNAYLAPKAPRSNRASSFAAGAALAVLIGLTLLVTTGCGGTAGDQGICFEACEHENACLGLSLDCKAPESNGTCSDASIQCNASCVASATCADLVGAQTMSSGLENGFIACNSACPHIE